MQELIDSVRKFHEQCNIPVDTRISRPTANRETMTMRDALLLACKDALETMAVTLQQQFLYDLEAGIPDPRIQRAQLVVEEVGELCGALAERSEVQVLDASADIIIVSVGNCVTYGLPLAEAIAEVQRVNATKHIKYGVAERFKPPDYAPPNLQRVLDSYRASMEYKNVLQNSGRDVEGCTDGSEGRLEA